MGKLEDFEKKQLKDRVPEFSIGDTVDVHVRIVEGDKQRIQIFSGTVIARKGAMNRETVTVRRIVAGEGVERVFPLHSPWIEEIRVKRAGKVRRAKLYYLRKRVGKATKVKERMSYEKRGTRKVPTAPPRATRKASAPAPAATEPEAPEPEASQPVGSPPV
ncbi:MAG: 50S ribosomal protein L19 [Planctomycetota bacterium]